jgi:site-specific recombinase XerD
MRIKDSNAMTTTALATTHAVTNVGDTWLVAYDTTDDRLVELWLHTGKRADSPRTQALYRRVWRAFSAIVGKPLQAVNLSDLQTWRESLKGAPATQRVNIATIRSLFAFGVRVGYLRMSPAVMLDSPKIGATTHRRTLSESNTLRMFDACQTAQETALLRVLYSSGARVSEVLALTWQDVTPRTAGGAVLHIVCGKGSKSRDAGISAAAYMALLALRDGAPDAAYCFATRTGAPLDRQRAHRILKDVAKRAGLKDSAGNLLTVLPSCHWLRHSHATDSLAHGANVTDVMAQLGHASLQTTSGYVHSTGYSCDKLAL